MISSCLGPIGTPMNPSFKLSIFLCDFGQKGPSQQIFFPFGSHFLKKLRTDQRRKAIQYMLWYSTRTTKFIETRCDWYSCNTEVRQKLSRFWLSKKKRENYLLLTRVRVWENQNDSSDDELFCWVVSFLLTFNLLAHNDSKEEKIRHQSTQTTMSCDSQRLRLDVLKVPAGRADITPRSCTDARFSPALCSIVPVRLKYKCQWLHPYW